MALSLFPGPPGCSAAPGGTILAPWALPELAPLFRLQ
ncbi:MAG: hypothetical protein KDC66_17255 [Phaeodactylibacter sp.]|nr:hypothetical protein [Phaeodactylibacter sp.]MCB9274116.1 hypothetical protein [Lewinellaceae bacterium]